MKILVYILAIVAFVVFSTQYSYALEINAVPNKEPFGPNDSITILVEVIGYQGGDIEWVAHKPDGSTDSGVLTALKGGKKNHIISRTAFDNQFGDWTIDYIYKEITNIITITVEPLTLELTLDKQTYHEGDDVVVTINTNHFDPNAAQAESYRIEIVDSNNFPVQHMPSTNIKAYMASTNFSIQINELLNNNPFGTYKVQVQYYNTFSEVQFSAVDVSPDASIFIGTDKSLYNPGDIVELQVILSELIDSEATIIVTDPNGKKSEYNFAVENSLTRVKLDELSTVVSGTYQLQLNYAGISETKTFVVEFESTVSNQPNIELIVSLDKQQYVPGEIITAKIKTDQLIADNISYWLIDPLGNQGVVVSKTVSSGNIIIPYSIPTNAELGPWKFFVNYGGAQQFAIFFVAGEQVEQLTTIFSDAYDGPKILLTIDSTKTNLNQPKGIAVDTDQIIFVVDSGNAKIKKFDSEGNLLSSWGQFGSGEGEFTNPTGIFVDSDHVHVADTGNSRIQTFDKDGNFVSSWGNSGIDSQSLKSPVSVSVESSGNFLVADTGLNKISKYDSEGNYAGHIESILTGAAKFYSSNYLVVDDSDSVLISVAEDNRILQYSSGGAFIQSFGTAGDDDGKFQNPTALSLDSTGNLYVADSGNSRIQVFDSNKKFLSKWGSLGNLAGQFYKIAGLAVDSSGNVYVSDPSNNRIQKFAPFTKSSGLEIPDWVRNNAQWWNEGTIEDSDFANGIQYMIQNEVIVIPDLGESGESASQQIPAWVKNNAGWWAAGQISDEDFANGIEFLVANGIIQV